jgi:ubiquinone biosynthesis protein
VLGQASQDFRRLRTIVSILAKYGYSELIKKTPQLERLASDVSEMPSRPQVDLAPRRFRAMLEELGSTFIKLGQILSTRPDLISPAYLEELKTLQNDCEPIPYAAIESAITTGLGAPPETLFADIDHEPLATASIAQVHRATTLQGDEVVVKVRRPGVCEEMRSDIVIMYRMAKFLDAVIEESAITESAGVVREFEKALNDELNFNIEAANCRNFRVLHKAREDIAVPLVYDELTSESIITLEFLKGTPFNNLGDEVDKKAIAARTVREAFDEVFIDGFFHGDPHPGNLLLLEDGRYGILDFGLCGQLTPQLREMLIVLVLAVAIKDADTAARTLYRLGQGESRVNIALLRDDLSALFEKWLGRTIKDVDSTLLMQELLLLAFKHRIRVPAEFTLLARAGATIEGQVRTFDPNIDIAKAAEPYAEKLLMDRVGPGNMQGSLYKTLLQMEGLSKDVPIQVSQIMADLSAGNFNVTVSGPDIERLRASIVMSAIAISGAIFGAAFVLGSFLAMSQLDWRMFGVPIVAVFGALGGITLFAWIVAYMVFRPRIKKFRLSNWLGKKRS